MTSKENEWVFRLYIIYQTENIPYTPPKLTHSLTTPTSFVGTHLFPVLMCRSSNVNQLTDETMYHILTTLNRCLLCEPRDSAGDMMKRALKLNQR